MSYPKYSFPPGLFMRALWDFLLLHRRDLQSDTKACIAHLNPGLRVLGQENIPQRGGCIVTINHYHRPGLGAQWLAIATTALVPLRMRWVVTAELMCLGKWYEAIGSRASRIFLKRLADFYGLTTMPPMPPRPKDAEARAASVLRILDYVKHVDDPVVGISPEGYNPPHGVLTRPAPGFGRFALLLSKAGMRFIPVGGYEADGIFHLHFGQAYELNVQRDLQVEKKDEHAMQTVMGNMARLLPVHLRGEFT